MSFTIAWTSFEKKHRRLESTICRGKHDSDTTFNLVETTFRINDLYSVKRLQHFSLISTYLHYVKAKWCQCVQFKKCNQVV